MATRGSAMSRVVKYFRDEDLDVAVITLQHLRNIVEARQRKEGPAGMDKPAVKRGRPAKSLLTKKENQVSQEAYSEGESLANA